jgi:hypothetical protein
MAKPVSLPRWASTGSADVVEPTSGKKDVGFVAGERPPAQYFNWLFELIYDWFAFLDTLFTSGGGLTATADSTITGALDVSQTVSFSGELSPASIGASQTDYAPTGHADAFLFLLTASGAYTINSLDGGVGGRMVVLFNTGANNITLRHDTAPPTGTDTMRFLCPGSTSYVLAPGSAVTCLYSAGEQRWLVIGPVV